MTKHLPMRVAYDPERCDMMHSRLGLLSMLLLAVQVQGAGQTDQAKLQGAWVLESEVSAGLQVPAEKIRGRKLIVRGSKYLFESPFTGGETGTFTVDEKKRPMTIDMTITDGPSKGKVRSGIFEQTDTTLRLCYTAESEERPTAFRSEAGRKTVVLVYQRAKP